MALKGTGLGLDLEAVVIEYIRDCIVVCVVLVVVGECGYIRLQHASTDALAAADNGSVCYSRHNHVLRGRTTGHRTSQTNCCGNPIKFLVELDSDLFCYNCIFLVKLLLFNILGSTKIWTGVIRHCFYRSVANCIAVWFSHL